MFAMFAQRWLHWLGHICCMDDGRIPIGWPALRYKDVCKRNLRAGGIDPADLETASSDHVTRWSTVKAGIKEAELSREVYQMGRMAAQETADTTFSTQQHPGQHVYLQQLQQTLPLKD